MSVYYKPFPVDPVDYRRQLYQWRSLTTYLKIKSESRRGLFDPTIDVEIAHYCNWSLGRLYFASEAAVSIYLRPTSSVSGLRCQVSS